MTATDHMRAALKALLAGDTAERDRRIKLAAELIAREEFLSARLRRLTPHDNLTTQ